MTDRGSLRVEPLVGSRSREGSASAGNTPVCAGRSIAFIINSLNGGGAERILSTLLFDMKDVLSPFDVHLILLDRQAEQHEVPSWVTKHVLNCNGGMLRSQWGLLRVLRKISPSVSISFLSRSNYANIIAGKTLGVPSVISERVNTSSHFSSPIGGAIAKLATRALYPRASQVIAVSRGVKSDLCTGYGVSNSKVHVVYNPIDPARIRRLAEERSEVQIDGPYIVAVGRLVPNKNFPLAIRAFARSGSRDRLVIMGEGRERDNLEQLREQLGLADRVLLVGHVANPYPIIRGARFLVSSSNAEGFPNVLLEAMALGCPVIATDCRSGPAEIVAGVEHLHESESMHSANGILVPPNSEERLAEAIMNMAQEPVRAEYAARGLRRALDFSPEKTVQGYWNVIRQYAEWPEAIA